MESIRITIPEVPKFKITLPGYGSGGTTDHAELLNLDFDNSGHTGFQKELTAEQLANLEAITSKIDKETFENELNGVSSQIPTRISELENDSGFVTEIELNEGIAKLQETVTDLSGDTTLTDMVFTHNNTNIYGEMIEAVVTLPSDIDTYNVFESSAVFTSGETAPSLNYSATPIVWSGDDCDSEGAFVPEANKTYEICIKKLGDIISARVGVILG